jgi:chromosome segregation ATPase
VIKNFLSLMPSIKEIEDESAKVKGQYDVLEKKLSGLLKKRPLLENELAQLTLRETDLRENKRKLLSEEGDARLVTAEIRQVRQDIEDCSDKLAGTISAINLATKTITPLENKMNSFPALKAQRVLFGKMDKYNEKASELAEIVRQMFSAQDEFERVGGRPCSPVARAAWPNGVCGALSAIPILFPASDEPMHNVDFFFFTDGQYGTAKIR